MHPGKAPVDLVGGHLAMEQELNPCPEGEGLPGVMVLSKFAPVYCQGVSIAWPVSALQQLLPGALALDR